MSHCAAPYPAVLAHLAIITPPLVGHLNALQALGRVLVARGHRVTLLGPEDARRWVWPGIGFEPVGAATHPAGHADAQAARMGRLFGPLGMAAMLRDLADDTAMIARDAPRAIERLGVDALVVDQLEPGGGVVARGLGLPYMSVACALPIERDADVPPVFVGWRYDPSSYGRWWNEGGHRVADWLMRRQHRELAAAAERFGLEPHSRPSDWISPTLSVSQTVRGLDYPRHAAPATLHHVGPLRVPDGRQFSIERDGRPLVFASLGTLQGARGRLFKAIAGAARDADMQLVMVHCGRLSPDKVAKLPGMGERGGPIVTDFVPQAAVLAQADLAVLHGGLNTVMDALATRTPMVVMPLAFEQPAIAARLERAGVAQKVSPWGTGWGGGRHDNLLTAMERVANDTSMSHRLGALAREIEKAGGAERAADLAETLLLGIEREESNVTPFPARSQPSADRGVA